jgi:hypothetical protein
MICGSKKRIIAGERRRKCAEVVVWFVVLNAAQADSFAFLASPGYS